MTLAKTLRFAFAIAASMISLGACTDLPTDPGSQRAQFAMVLPAVTDARLRLNTGISDVATRQQVTLALFDIESALRQGNAERARIYIGSVTSVLNKYRSPASGADVTAIFLALDAASSVVDSAVQP
jgi:hypothetical protein